MTSVYIVSDDDGDAGTIVYKICSSMELARAFVARLWPERDPNSWIEEWQVDDIDMDWLEGRVSFWRVDFGLNMADYADVTIVEREHNYMGNEIESGNYSGGWYVTVVRADSKENAIEIARNRRAAWWSKRPGGSVDA